MKISTEVKKYMAHIGGIGGSRKKTITPKFLASQKRNALKRWVEWRLRKQADEEDARLKSNLRRAKAQSIIK